MEKKEQYMEVANDRVKKVLDQVEDLQTRAQKAKEETNNEIDEQIKKLEERKKVIRESLEELKKSTEDTWDEKKNEFEANISDNFFDRFKFMMADLGDRMNEVSQRADQSFDSFYRQAKMRVQEWTERIRELEKKNRGRSQEEIQKEIQFLKEKRDELNQQLNQMSQSSGEAWNELKNGFMEAGRSIRGAFQNAFKHF